VPRPRSCLNLESSFLDWSRIPTPACAWPASWFLRCRQCSLLAFTTEINHLGSPLFYGRRDQALRNFAVLMDRAAGLVFQEQVYWLVANPDHAFPTKVGRWLFR